MGLGIVLPHCGKSIVLPNAIICESSESKVDKAIRMLSSLFKLSVPALRLLRYTHDIQGNFTIANCCIADVNVWYERTSYTISQQNDNVTICVISTSPGIEEMFTIDITNNRTASKYFCYGS